MCFVCALIDQKTTRQSLLNDLKQKVSEIKKSNPDYRTLFEYKLTKYRINFLKEEIKNDEMDVVKVLIRPDLKEDDRNYLIRIFNLESILKKISNDEDEILTSDKINLVYKLDKFINNLLQYQDLFDLKENNEYWLVIDPIPIQSAKLLLISLKLNDSKFIQLEDNNFAFIKNNKTVGILKPRYVILVVFIVNFYVFVICLILRIASLTITPLLIKLIFIRIPLEKMFFEDNRIFKSLFELYLQIPDHLFKKAFICTRIVMIVRFLDGVITFVIITVLRISNFVGKIRSEKKIKVIIKNAYQRFKKRILKNSKPQVLVQPINLHDKSISSDL